MAFESANYIFRPQAGTLDDLRAMLTQMGGTSTGPTTWVLEGEDHWIDVQLRDGPPLAVSVRIALTNPLAALNRLRDLVDRLWTEFDGTLSAPNERASFLDGSEETWKVLFADYQARREQFRKHLGDIEAPVSAEDVYTLIDERAKRPDR